VLGDCGAISSSRSSTTRDALDVVGAPGGQADGLSLESLAAARTIALVVSLISMRPSSPRVHPTSAHTPAISNQPPE
jgi:hypothetical protein